MSIFTQTHQKLTGPASYLLRHIQECPVRPPFNKAPEKANSVVKTQPTNTVPSTNARRLLIKRKRKTSSTVTLPAAAIPFWKIIKRNANIVFTNRESMTEKQMTKSDKIRTSVWIVVEH